VEYWRYKGETWQLLQRAEPNPAHLALADLLRAGRLELLVTQNVDGLHERSGVPAERLVTIHGTDAAVGARCGRAPREGAGVGRRALLFPLRLWRSVEARDDLRAGARRRRPGTGVRPRRPAICSSPSARRSSSAHQSDVQLRTAARAPRF
jgi:hypothetical protein